MRKQTESRNRGWLSAIGNRLSVAAGVALAAGLLAGTAWGGTIVSQGTGNWGAGTTWVGGVAPQSGDDVYIATGHTVTMTGVTTRAVNSLTITGTLTHAAVTTTGSTIGDEDNMINLSIAGNLTIDSAGQINVDSVGYGVGKGPGAGGYDRGGGSYGGKGTPWQPNAPINPPYGSITNPVNSGSGGYNTAGGGAVVILVTGAITNSGTITAKGDTAGVKGRGSGGTINLTANSIASTGIICADGVSASIDPGASGGGRIALRLTGDGSDFSNVTTNNITAYGATAAYAPAGQYASSAGTIYLKTKAQTYGTLLVKNNNLVTSLDTPLAIGTNRFDTIDMLSSNILLSVSSTRLLDLTYGTLSSASVTNSLVVDATAGGGQFVVVPSTYTNTFFQVLIWRGTNRMSLTCDLTIPSGGILTHDADGNSRIDLDLTGNLTIKSGAKIDLYGKGYAAGGGPGGTASARTGGSYGGLGGWYDNASDNTSTTYGSITNPVQCGSGGHAAAGGAVVLRVTGALTNEGTINANAVGGSSISGAGAGGSINLTADSISGAGAITANGGFGDVSGGGGGRIAVRLTGTGQTLPASVLTSITAYGGNNTYGKSSAHGAAGTIYLKTKEQDRGVLLVKNNVDSSRSTLIDSGMADEDVGDVQLAGTAAQTSFAIASGRTLPVYGSWSNAATSTIGGAGTVEFKGATTNTIYGSTTFYSLVCTNAGKTLLFQAGTTNTVTAALGLRLTGASGDGNKVSLLPATPSSQWYIKSVNTPANVSYVAVSNSTVATSGGVASITAQNSDDLGGNTNWVFANPDAITWISLSDTNWNTPANWVTAGGVHRAPVADDPSITISNNTAIAALIDASYVYNGNLIVQSGATMNLNGKALTIGGNLIVQSGATMNLNTLTIGGCLTNAGTLVATASETLTVSKDVDFTGGAFTPATSKLILNAASGTQTFKPGGCTFHRIEVPNAITLNVSGGGFTAAQLYCRAAGATLNFQEGLTYTVTDLLDLRGTSSSKVILRRIGSTTRWNLNLSGRGQMVRYVDVQDSNASGNTIYAIDSIGELQNNVNWNFTNGKFWTGGTTDWATTGNWSPSGAPGATNYVIFDGTGSAPTLSGSTTISGLTVNGPVTATVNMAYGQILNVSNDVYIGGGAGLTHSAVTSTGSNLEDNRLLMHVGGAFTLAAGGAIDVSEKGYGSLQGPGAGASAGDARGGGGHGGAGGNGYLGIGSGTTYGSVTNPVRCGSGGSSGPGGGCVVLTIDGAATINGTIAAKGGKQGTGAQGGGAGGTVNIVASTISGTGTLTVMGGRGSDGGGAAGGGGGRIAMRLTTGFAAQCDTLAIQAYGGLRAGSLYGEQHGAAGTIYIHGTNSTYGRLLVDNNSLSTTSRTLISSNVTDATVGDVVLKNLGYMGIATGQTLTVNGSWSNAVATNAISGGTVVFAGTDPNPVSVWGGNTWSNLTIATAGKTVNFEAGKTQFVYGVASFSNVTLKSTASAYWYLLKPGSGTQDVGKVTVQYSNAGGGWAFRPAGGQDLGNNVNWIFPPKGTVFMMR
jgi:hypothetical protein